MILKGEEVVIDAGGFKISIPCSSDPDKLVGDGKIKLPKDLTTFKTRLEELGIFDDVRISDDLGAVIIKYRDSTIFLFKSGEVNFVDFNDKKKIETLGKMIISMLYFSKFNDANSKKILSKFTERISQEKNRISVLKKEMK
jgi:hypothetical protein